MPRLLDSGAASDDVLSLGKVLRPFPLSSHILYKYTYLETIILEFPIVAKVEIYTSALCGYCSRAKNLLEKKGINLIEYDVTFDSGKRQEMSARSGKTAVPQVFIDDNPVGGSSDLIELDVDGELDVMLGIGTALSQ